MCGLCTRESMRWGWSRRKNAGEFDVRERRRAGGTTSNIRRYQADDWRSSMKHLVGGVEKGGREDQAKTLMV